MGEQTPALKSGFDRCARKIDIRLEIEVDELTEFARQLLKPWIARFRKVAHEVRVEPDDICANIFPIRPRL
jgi:hypothetical protein